MIKCCKKWQNISQNVILGIQNLSLFTVASENAQLKHYIATLSRHKFFNAKASLGYSHEKRLMECFRTLASPSHVSIH